MALIFAPEIQPVPKKMNLKQTVSQVENSLSFITECNSTTSTFDETEDFKVGDLKLRVRTMRHFSRTQSTTSTSNIFIKMYLPEEKTDLIYKCIVTVYELPNYSSNSGKINLNFSSGDDSWRLIYTGTKIGGLCVTFRIEKTVYVGDNSPFSSLIDDNELIDFELRGKDGSVWVHGAVLATSSPAFKRMLQGKWKETEQRYVHLENVTKTTLQHLKNFIYLNAIPETGVKELLLLASCYMMPTLEKLCVDRLLNNLTESNIMELSRFALTHNMTSLYKGFLKRVKSGAVNIDKIDE